MNNCERNKNKQFSADNSHFYAQIGYSQWSDFNRLLLLIRFTAYKRGSATRMKYNFDLFRETCYKSYDALARSTIIYFLVVR